MAKRTTCPGHSSAEFVSAQKLVDRHEIPQALRHLFAFDLQMAVVHPDIGHHFMPEGGAALRHFVFMMREQEVDAAAMNVEHLAEVFPARRRTFDVPAGTALPPRALPAGLRADPGSKASTGQNPSARAYKARPRPARPRSFRRAGASRACRKQASTAHRTARRAFRHIGMALGE